MSIVTCKKSGLVYPCIDVIKKFAHKLSKRSCCKCRRLESSRFLLFHCCSHWPVQDWLVPVFLFFLMKEKTDTISTCTGRQHRNLLKNMTSWGSLSSIILLSSAILQQTDYDFVANQSKISQTSKPACLLKYWSRQRKRNSPTRK